LLCRIRKRARPSATARRRGTGFTTGTPSYLFITHDLAVVRWISHRIEVMRSGRIVESGPTARICEEPREDYTKALLAAAPVPDPRAMPGGREPWPTNCGIQSPRGPVAPSRA
jgi:ABC-type dipeptide/oligopeptide/nickel transport system ATPase component